MPQHEGSAGHSCWPCCRSLPAMVISSQWGWVSPSSFAAQTLDAPAYGSFCTRGIRSCMVRYFYGPELDRPSLRADNNDAYSSAKDQLTETSVAIKKIMKPFSTPVLSKRTYRELKLLKHIQHENVWTALKWHYVRAVLIAAPQKFLQIISLRDVFISPQEDM